MSRQELGDWQTPPELAAAVMRRLASMISAPSVVLEPTCGEGAFLRAAEVTFDSARLVGYEINTQYVEVARARQPTAEVINADFFDVKWERVLADLPEPILVVGNPPWVTNSTLGTLDSRNLPEKTNFKSLGGFEALTGKSNFDVSEWMLLRLLSALRGRRFTVGVLCKSVVARKVIEFAAAKNWDVGPGGIWRIDAMKHFQAAVDAVLFVCTTGAQLSREWPVYASIEAEMPVSLVSYIDGSLVADAERYAASSHLLGDSDPEWRSGLKHDCSRVMELERTSAGWLNGLGDVVDIEDELVYPLLKSSDVAKGTGTSRKGVIVPQRTIGEDTSVLKHTSPKAWEYLDRHREHLSARKSSIYRGQPDFAIFGIGPYSFAPWKVAISGLYKKCQFTLVAPQGDRPVMVDDTCYFLPFDDEPSARAVCDALQLPIAQDFLLSRIFWDSKRPINKAVLQRLNLDALLTAAERPRKARPIQARLAL